MPEDSTIRCFDSHAEAYDLFQSTVVPEYSTSMEITAMALERYAGLDLPGRTLKVLDLGCGTGNASARVLARFPKAELFLVDGSPSMIRMAREKLEKISPGSVAGFRVADLAGDSWHEGLEGGYDAVISTFVLEHLEFERYRAVLGRCLRLLRPGGWLLAVEGYVEEESDMLGWFEELMEKRKVLVEDEELSKFVSNLRAEEEVHYYSSKAQKAAWWQEAGFERVHVVWQYLCVALMAGRRPLE